MASTGSIILEMTDCRNEIHGRFGTSFAKTVAMAFCIFVTSAFFAHTAAAFQLDVVTPEGKLIQPNESATAVFLAKSEEPAPVTYRLSFDVATGAIVISSLSDVTLQPGQEFRIPVSFIPPSQLPDDNLDISAALTMTPVGGSAGPAAAVASLRLESIVCAVISVDDELPASALAHAFIPYKIKNCGNRKETFDIQPSPGNGIMVWGFTGQVTLDPGAESTMMIEYMPKIETGAYESEMAIAVLRNKVTVAVKHTKIIVSPNIRPKGSENRMVFPVSVNVEYLMRSKQKNKMSLAISTPYVTGSGFGFKSNVLLDTRSNADGDKLETTRATYNLAHNDTELVLGHQTSAFSRMLSSHGNRTYDGVGIMQSLGKAKLSFINADDENGTQRVYGITVPATPKLTVRAGYLDAETGRHRTFSGISANTIAGTFKYDQHFSVKGEFASSNRLRTASQTEEKGRAATVTGSYMDRKLQINATTQYGNRLFAVDSFTSKNDVNIQRKYKRVTISAGYIYQTVTTDVTTPDAPLDIKRNLSHDKLRTVGVSHVLRRKGSRSTTIAIRAKRREYETTDTAIADVITVAKNSGIVTLSQQLNKLSFTAGLEIGREHSLLGVKKIRDVDFSTTYSGGRFAFDASLRRDLNYSLNLGADADVTRRYSTKLTYKLPQYASLIAMGYRREYQNSTLNEMTEKFLLYTERKFSAKNTLRLEYEISRSKITSDRSLTATLSRALDVKIPYKKFGTVGGRLFVDSNHNGIYDDGEKPVPGVSLTLKDGQNYYARTKADGTYIFKEVVPDNYVLEVDKSSFPVGVALANGSSYKVKIKNGKDVQINIKFQSLFRVSGKVAIDDSNFFVRYSNISNAGLRILLMKDGQIETETFTDRNGNYHIDNIKPGAYEVAIDVDWLPGQSVVIGLERIKVICGVPDPAWKQPTADPSSTPNSRDCAPAEVHIIDCMDMNNCTNIDFTIGIKTKDIKKTYSKNM